MNRALQTSFLCCAKNVSRLLLFSILIWGQTQVISARNKAKTQKKSQVERTVSQINDEKYRLYYLESLVQREKGNLTAQYELLKRAIELKPDASEAFFDLAENLSRGELLPDSLVSAYYQKAITLTRNQNANYQEAYARFVTEIEDYDAAIPVWKQLTSNPFKRQTAYEELSTIYSQRQNYDTLLQLLEEWANNGGDAEDVDNQRLRLLKQLERYDEEIALLDKWIQSNPDNPFYLITKAEALLAKNDTKAAWNLYKDIIVSNPDYSYARIFPVYYYERLEQRDSMLSAMKSVILDPSQYIDLRVILTRSFINEFPESQVDTLFSKLFTQALPDKQLPELYVNFLLKNKRPDSAFIAPMRKILEVEPENDRSRTILIQDALDHRQYQKTIELCQEGIRFNPRKLIYYQIGGGSLYQLHQTKASIALFEKGLKYVPFNKDKETISYFYCVYADALHGSKNNRKAYAYYDSSLVYNPSNVLCLNNYAYHLALSGEQLDKALHMSELAIKLEPNNPTYIDTYAWILFMKKDYVQARAYIEDVLKLIGDDPEDAGLYEHAGDIYIQLGQKHEAKTSWLKAKKLGSDSKTLERKIKNMKYYSE